MKKEFIYIASPLKYSKINNEIAEALSKNKFDFFLPETINLRDALEHLKQIGELCFNNIDRATIIIVVSPFGLSTASETGYAINRKRKGENIIIILFDTDQSMYKLEAAITPYFDTVVYSLTDLIKALNNYK